MFPLVPVADKVMASTILRLRFAFVLAFFLFLAPWSLTGCENKNPAPPHPATLEITPAKSLSPDERDLEKRFLNAIQNNLNVFIAAYRWKWPKVINTDNARELCQEYAPDGFDVMTERNKEHRAKYALGTQAPARALAMEVYRQMLKEAPTASEESLVVFTAGGAGSGKSTSVASVEQLQRRIDQAQIVVDTTLSSQLSLEQIKMALDAGKAVNIFYVYRDPELAFNGVLERANRTGRPVTISNFIDTHLGAPAALDNVTERFGQEIKNGTIEVLVIDNTGDISGAKLVQDGMVFVRKRTAGYSKDGLRRQLHDLLKDAYEKRLISKEDFETMDK